MEWIVTLENTSIDQSMEYLVHVLPTSAEDWLVVGHSGGVIPAFGSTNLMLYIARQQVGRHACLLAIENTSNASEAVQYVSVRVEVVLGANLQKRSQ